MAKYDFGFANLSKAIDEEFSLIHKEGNLKQRSHRGNFGVQLLLQALISIDVKTIKLHSIIKYTMPYRLKS
jgi:hypothetical protein